jgi:hypothetical protein
MDSYVEVDGRPIGFFTSILVCWAWLKAKIFGFGFFFFFYIFNIFIFNLFFKNKLKKELNQN